MGNAHAVSIQTTVASPVAAIPYLHHLGVTFVPEESTFRTNFENSTAPWMFRDANTDLGLVAEVGPENWRARLLSLGATSEEPIWTWCAAFFGPLAVADANGNRARVQKPDALYLCRRTSAVPSQNTVQFTSNTAGRVRVRVSQSKYLYAGETPAGALSDTTVVADGILTVAQLANALAAQLTAIPGFVAHFTAISDGVDTVTVESNEPGYPLILSITKTSPGPALIQTITTANVPNAYYDDLTEIQAAAELGPNNDPPIRRIYWLTDLQLDDTVNTEGAQWVEDQANTALFSPPRDYLFKMGSSSGARDIKNIGGAGLGNFDPLATASAAGLAAVANGGTGWTRAGVYDHPRHEFLIAALAGRTIAYLPGEISFTAKVLQGDNPAARMSPLDYGDNESLTLADSRRFNYYSADAPGGMCKWGFLANGSFFDRVWLADYVTYVVRTAVVQWMTLNNITTYTDDTLGAGAGVISAAIATVPAVIPDTIGVVFIGRDQVVPANIVARIYFDYTGSGTSGGIINQFGTPSSPIPITIIDG